MRFLKLGALVAAAALVVGCTSNEPKPIDPDEIESGEKPVVLTTFTVLADIAQNVGGEHVEVASIIKPGAEVHGYEPTPSEIAKASEADLVLENGMGLEAWFAQFIRQADVPSVVVSEGVEVLDITDDEAAGTPNPHAWMSPVEAQVYIENIAAAFSDLLPEHADDFAENAAAYSEEVRQVHESMLVSLDTLPMSQRALVTCEGAFSYLARDAGLTEQYLWAVNAEQQATPRQITKTLQFVTANDVPAVFCESTVSDAAMQQVVSGTDAEFGGTLYVDSLSESDGPVPTYLDLLRFDTDLIVAGLVGESA